MKDSEISKSFNSMIQKDQKEYEEWLDKNADRLAKEEQEYKDTLSRPAPRVRLMRNTARDDAIMRHEKDSV